MIRRRVRVTGRVQGVFYRDSCRRQARRLGVAGWVSNRPDGSVEAVFEGETDVVEQLIAWARRGSPQSRVDDVEVSEEDPEGESGFRVT